MATSGTVRLSVDLGTTWTAAGASAGREAQPIMLGSDGPAMPSVVALVNGELVAGTAAARASAVDPASAAREFKRRLGDTTPIVLAGTPYGAETLMGHLLAHVVRTATAQVGAPRVVTLTHPAVFGAYKLDLLREAARVAGLATVELLSEPEAAALQYARLGRLSTGDTVAVYDFGGGTFDAAIVRLGTDGPTLLGRPEGLERLGGIDLDHAVLAHVDASLDGALAQLDTSDPDVRRAVGALREACVQAKEALSADTEATVPVTVPGLDTVVRITRSEFEAFVRPRLAETLGALDRAIASAGLTAGDLAGIVLVGGSSRIPVVVEQVGAHSGRPLLVDADPKLVVALGAVAHNDRQPTAPEEFVMATTTPPAGGEPATPKATDDPKGKAEADPMKGATRERRTAPGAHEPEKGGLSTAGKVAAGVAAAGLAAATTAFWRDDIENAVGLGDDDADARAQAPVDPDGLPAAAAIAEAEARDAAAALDAEAAAAASAAPPAPAAPVAESMDAFDEVAGPAVAPAARVAPQGGGVRQARVDAADVAAPASAPTPGPAPQSAAAPGPTFAAAAPPPAAAATASSVAPPVPPPAPVRADAPPAPTAMGDGEAAFDDARSQLLDRLAGWQPPEGADPAEVAELRTRLEGLVDRYEPGPNQSVDQAIADLRDQFELRIDNFTQDLKIDALIEQVGEGGMPAGPDPMFEAQRAALRASLADWKAPEGTSPEDAAELQAQLQTLVDTYQPPAGVSAEDAMAALQAEFQDQVHDFTQDQKIDALVDEVEDLREQAGMPAGPDPMFEAQRAALRASLADWKAPEGTSPEDAAELQAQLQTLVDTYQPPAGVSAEDAMAALQAEFQDQVHDFTQDQKIDALVDEVEDLRAEATTAGDEATRPAETQTGTVKTQVLVDDFEEMIGEPAAPANGDTDDAARPGFAVGERPPGEPVRAPVLDIDDDMFAVPDGDAPMTVEAELPTNTGIVPPVFTLDDDDTFGVADLREPALVGPAGASAADTEATDATENLAFDDDLDQPAGDLDDDFGAMHDPLTMTSDDLMADDDLTSLGTRFDDDRDDLDIHRSGPDDVNDR